MPVFKSVKGGHVFVPADNIILAEAGPGGLTTVLTWPMPSGMMQCEVEGSALAAGEAILAEKRPAAPAPVPPRSWFAR